MRLCSKCSSPLENLEEICRSCGYSAERRGGFLTFAPELADGNEGFEAHYFAKLADLEAGNFWFRSRNRLLTWALQQYFPQAKTFLEIGCGTGFVLSGIHAALPGLTVCGSEVFSAGLSFAAKRLPGIELFQMDARRIPFRDEFDVIGAFDVLEHVNEDEEVLSQMRQATRKGGGILVTVPQHPLLWSRVDEYARHVRRYRARELKDKVRRAGFKVVRSTSFVSLLLPLLMVSRLKQRLSSQEFDPESEFNISDLTNITLEKVLDAERSLIRAGLSLPIGGSLVLVARRD
jgi:SAM-dependent methyltransferase